MKSELHNNMKKKIFEETFFRQWEVESVMHNAESGEWTMMSKTCQKQISSFFFFLLLMWKTMLKTILIIAKYFEYFYILKNVDEGEL